MSVLVRQSSAGCGVLERGRGMKEGATRDTQTQACTDGRRVTCRKEPGERGRRDPGSGRLQDAAACIGFRAHHLRVPHAARRCTLSDSPLHTAPLVAQYNTSLKRRRIGPASAVLALRAQFPVPVPVPNSAPVSPQHHHDSPLP
ncbi:hypothetical protein SNOG_00512 [Parastagonospora nodorum SN15]|uniref:Uncharacterized protein n=1 Tax=Phaeosphaeria nodorum (strain SN15 / ATCC MYA-4574 / FGSC 10173) TaxID=321614 RepID=Q0V652_PHANO|nr:hypothetical protein SNOG_00512 [Parastagonospora nodorum SN15]EAT92007.1 hypothetical protein SNOG_00512 [Parastagonospora nodorum SN15]